MNLTKFSTFWKSWKLEIVSNQKGTNTWRLLESFLAHFERGLTVCRILTFRDLSILTFLYVWPKYITTDLRSKRGYDVNLIVFLDISTELYQFLVVTITSRLTVLFIQRVSSRWLSEIRIILCPLWTMVKKHKIDSGWLVVFFSQKPAPKVKTSK